jgi:hypothetical protein
MKLYIRFNCKISKKTSHRHWKKQRSTSWSWLRNSIAQQHNTARTGETNKQVAGGAHRRKKQAPYPSRRRRTRLPRSQNPDLFQFGRRRAQAATLPISAGDACGLRGISPGALPTPGMPRTPTPERHDAASLLASPPCPPPPSERHDKAVAWT